MKKTNLYRWAIPGVAAVLVLGAVVFSHLTSPAPAITQEELDFHNGDTQRALRSHTLWTMAQEQGFTDAFSYQSFLEDLEEVNAQRQQAHQQGEVLYGPVQYTDLQYYKIILGELERQLKDSIIAQATEEELVGYYQQNAEQYRESDTVEAQYTIWENRRIVYQTELVLDESNVRMLSESDETLTNQLLQLEKGDETEWYGENGEIHQLVCTQRTQGEIPPFEDVSGAVSEQYASYVLETELEKRM